MKKTIILFALMLSISNSVEAQFFKKLGKKVEKAAEKAVERKVENKTTKETEKAFDSTFNKKPKSKKRGGLPGFTNVSPSSSYAFNYRAEMRLQSGKDVMDIHYFLPKNGNFLCALIKDKKTKDNLLTVFDIEKDAMFTFMENDGQKIKMGVDLKSDGAAAAALNETSIKISKTGNTKKILGYNCEEYKMSGEDMTATIWVTKEVDIRFPNGFYNIKQENNDNQSWMKNMDGWAMEMHMIDTSKKKPQTIIMNCLSINDTDLIINSNDYQNLGY